MSKVYTTFNPSELNCPVCADELKKVTYYSAFIAGVDRETIHGGITTTTTTTKYTNILQNTGGICFSCGLKKFNKMKKYGLILLISGFCLVLSIQMIWTVFNLPQNIFVGFFAPIMFAGFVAIPVGIVFLIKSFKYRGFKKPISNASREDTDSYLFIENLDRTKIPNKHCYFSTSMYKQMSEQ
jgi:hypothetical protein